MIIFPNLFQKLEEINKTLPKEIYREAYRRLLDKKIIVEEHFDNGEIRYLLGIKGIQNTFGATAEDNAKRTFTLISKYANYCRYKFDFLVNTFNLPGNQPLKSMIVCEIDKEFYNTIKLGKAFNELEKEIIKNKKFSNKTAEKQKWGELLLLD